MVGSNIAKSKRQFKGVVTKRDFFDRKVRKQGNTTVISLGKIIPKSWKYVRVELIGRKDDIIIVRFKKLYEEKNNAKNK